MKELVFEWQIYRAMIWIFLLGMVLCLGALSEPYIFICLAIFAVILSVIIPSSKQSVSKIEFNQNEGFFYIEITKWFRAKEYVISKEQLTYVCYKARGGRGAIANFLRIRFGQDNAQIDIDDLAPVYSSSRIKHLIQFFEEKGVECNDRLKPSYSL
jgi:hypothetical protein